MVNVNSILYFIEYMWYSKKLCKVRGLVARGLVAELVTSLH